MAATPAPPPPPTSRPAKGGKERVVTPPPAEQPPVITVQNEAQLHHQRKNRAEAHYKDLTPVELARLPKTTLNKVGKRFVDSLDTPDIYTGVITAIVRQNKTNTVCFKYFDPNLYSSAP